MEHNCAGLACMTVGLLESRGGILLRIWTILGFSQNSLRLTGWNCGPYFLTSWNGVTDSRSTFFFSFPLGLMAYILFESQSKLTTLFLLRHVIGSLSIFSSWIKRMTCVT